MYLTKEQKQYFIVALVFIVILGMVSFLSKPSFRYVDTVDYSKKQPQQFDAAAYLKYLDSLKVDPKASQQLFQDIITEKDIEKEVDAALKTDQPITPPVIKDESLVVSKDSGQEAVVSYLSSTSGLMLEFSNKTKEFNQKMFAGDLDSMNTLAKDYDEMIKKLTKVETPKEALPLQKSLVTAYVSYGRVLENSKSYASDTSKDPWPDVYHDYTVINKQMSDYYDELQSLSNKYKLAEVPIYPFYAEKDSGFHLIKTAHAIFGFGDVTITVGDIPRLIMDAVKEGLVSSFSQFMGSFLDKMVAKIESNYMIANFLYYSDALVSGQYLDDYLNKYVSNNLDQQIIKKFIPQLNCGRQSADLRPIFKAKAQEYLGFNPENLDPKDPDYYQKLARVGNFMASPNGWQIYYEDLASQAKSEAEKAAEKELTSPGLKTPRDSINNGISASINSIVSGEKAAMDGMIQLGISNASSFVSRFVSQMTQTLMNKFVFRGVSTGAPGVLKEQSTCLAAAQMQVVLPTSGTFYQEPSAAPNQDDLINQECQKFPRACQTPAPLPSVEQTGQ